MHLNEEMRSRFRRLAEDVEESRDGLRDASIERIVAATLAYDAEQRRRQRNLRIAAASVTAMAAAALLYARSAPRATVAVDADHAPRCASMSTDASHWASTSSASRYELDRRARVDAAEASIVSVDSGNACASDVRLVRGSVAVWARDLAGGQLVVHAGDVRVVVHGTVFEVRVENDGSRYVAVREGRVEVAHRGASHWLVSGGALRVSAEGLVSTTSVDASARDRLARVLDEGPIAVMPATPVAAGAPVAQPAAEARVEAPIETVVDPAAALREAEVAYRAGRMDEARRMFRRVGATRGTLAEAAWIRLGRLEMQAGRTSDAARALSEHRRRFPSGSLAAEARVAEARALRALGRGSEADALESWVVEHRPDSPYAQAIRDRRP